MNHYGLGGSPTSSVLGRPFTGGSPYIYDSMGFLYAKGPSDPP
jgi:hypothetical protein